MFEWALTPLLVQLEIKNDTSDIDIISVQLDDHLVVDDPPNEAMALSVLACSLFEAFRLAKSDDAVYLLLLQLFDVLQLLLGERQHRHRVNLKRLKVSDDPFALLFVIFEALDKMPILLQ